MPGTQDYVSVHTTGPVMGEAHSIELVRTELVLLGVDVHRGTPGSTMRRMPTGFSATIITIPSVYVVPYATPLGGKLVRNVLVLER
jgi:hypothetical protein